MKKIYNKLIKSFQVTKIIREISNEKPSIWVVSLKAMLKGPPLNFSTSSRNSALLMFLDGINLHRHQIGHLPLPLEHHHLVVQLLPSYPELLDLLPAYY